MTTDTPNTGNTMPYGPCGRRWCHTNQEGTTYKCKPPKVLPNVPFEERMALLIPRSIQLSECFGCPMVEPVEQQEVGVVRPDELNQGTSPTNAPPVTPEVQPDGSLVYRMTGPTPPPIPPGYKRKSDDVSSPDSWVFIHDVARCQYLTWKPEHQEGCNCLAMIPYCKLDDKEVLAEYNRCKDCVHATVAAIETPPTLAKLSKLQGTLPPFVEGRDRPAHFEEGGAIVYEVGDWEPPRDIEGYERDPDNELRFVPKWPECIYRAETAVRYSGCGCIGVIARCACPGCPRFTQRVKCDHCMECPHRKEVNN